MFDRVPVKCIFCDSTLTTPVDCEYKSGDLIECQSCGEFNDYDSLVEVTSDRALQKVTKHYQDKLNAIFKGAFKAK